MKREKKRKNRKNPLEVDFAKGTNHKDLGWWNRAEGGGTSSAEARETLEGIQDRTVTCNRGKRWSTVEATVRFGIVLLFTISLFLMIFQ